MGSIMEVECPKEYYECLTYEEFDEIVDLLEENDIAMPETMGDAEAAANFVWNVLFLTPMELVYIGISMSVLAFYGLSIYYMYKKIQKKFS
tara:strand:- start:11 stop:283 length:273 start_codon:yes stop_codon:yes gene_type:complete